MRKEIKFEKVVEYKYPNGDKFEDGVLAFYTASFIVMIVHWIFFPLFFIFDEDCWVRGQRKKYWRKMK